jgi:hypothetical protein
MSTKSDKKPAGRRSRRAAVSRRQRILFLTLSVIIGLSMIVGYVIIALPQPAPPEDGAATVATATPLPTTTESTPVVTDAPAPAAAPTAS